MRFPALILAALAALALAIAPLSAPAAAAAPPCDYNAKVYCDGGDEPGWQWDTIDDIACVQIPGATLDANDKPDYSKVVGKVYYKGALVWDSTPKAPAKPKPKPKPAPAKPAAKPATPAAKPAAKPSPVAAKPSATPTPTATPTLEAVAPAAGTVTVTGTATPGETITLTGADFDGNLDDLVVELHSDPEVTLATVATDTNGGFTLQATIPESVPAGDHTIVVLIDGVEVSRTPVTVGAATSTPNPGIFVLGGVFVLGAATLGVYALRRRRAASAPAAPVL